MYKIPVMLMSGRPVLYKAIFCNTTCANGKKLTYLSDMHKASYHCRQGFDYHTHNTTYPKIVDFYFLN